MAELLMVVAILVALFGVAFVAVQNHQRSMTQLEYDTIAKEIFVAAQNHLTAAESQGYLGQITGPSGYGEESSFDEDETDEVYYVTKGATGQGTILDLMLPFGSIDETIRAGGSYIIRYQPSSARVLDVFYSNPGPVTAWLTISGEPLDGKYANLMENFRGDDKKADRRRCSAINGAVVGWYGDGDALPVGDKLEAPQVLIHNEETLCVEVTDTNASDISLVLIVTGETSKAKKAFDLRKSDTRVSTVAEGYKIILDDITGEKLHFADLDANTATEFIPGENLTIEAVAYNNNALTNVAYSGKGRTNSLFADPSSYEVAVSADLSPAELTKINGTVVFKAETDSTANSTGIAAVANFRHLENLDKYVSGCGKDETLNYTAAVQLTNLTDDLSWTKFIGDATFGDTVCSEEESSYKGKTGKDKYWPVNLEKGFVYDGRGHSISDVVTDGNAPGEDKNVGLFRTLNGCTVRNLELLDFMVKGTGTANAGALAGTISDAEGANTSVSNVLVRNSKENDSSFSSTKNITADASAGGLIGSMSGGVVTGCATAVYVSGGTNAGGLIGSASGGSVTACYSAGHTKDGSYQDWLDVEGHGYDVTGATAGGLIGSSTADLTDSYSTCSVSGTSTAGGGFVGNASGGSIDNCYAVGLVETDPVGQGSRASNRGAFAGTASGTASFSDCLYYGIINEVKRTEGQDGTATTVFDHYLGAVGDAADAVDGITEIDLNADTYGIFVGAPDDWTKAEPNDDALNTYYQGKYNLKGISRLAVPAGTSTGGTTDTTEPIVYTHYGDWPAPEIFIVNSSSNS